jgi:hypothetical protein
LSLRVDNPDFAVYGFGYLAGAEQRPFHVAVTASYTDESLNDDVFLTSGSVRVVGLFIVRSQGRTLIRRWFRPDSLPLAPAEKSAILELFIGQ